MEKYKFKQIRFIEWIKTNPVPLNQSVNYLSNTRVKSLFLVLKVGNLLSTLNMIKEFMNTQYRMVRVDFILHKSIPLFEELIKKTQMEDIVLDTFFGWRDDSNSL